MLTRYNEACSREGGQQGLSRTGRYPHLYMKWFKWRNTRWGAYTFAALSAVLFFVVLEHIGGILSGLGKFIGFFAPVLYGLIIAYILDFFVKFIERRLFRSRLGMGSRLSRVLAVFMTVAVVILLFVLLLIAVIPSIVGSITDIVNNWSSYVDQLTKLVTHFSKTKNGAAINASDVNHAINRFADQISSYLSKNYADILATLSSVGSRVLSVILAFIVAIYFLLAKNELLAGSKKLFFMIMPRKTHARSNTAFARVNAIFSKYIVCEIIDAFLVGCSNAVFMLIAKMPFVALVSVIVGVTNLAPTFGPIVGGVIGSALLLLVKPTAVIPFIIFTLILQTIDGYVIKPKMYGGALSVPSVWVLVAIIVLGRMFGVAGILLAIPVAAIITYWLRDVMRKVDDDGEPIAAEAIAQSQENAHDRRTAESQMRNQGKLRS